VKDGAVWLGDTQITEVGYKIRKEDFDRQGNALLRAGSKKRAILTLKSE
jgi:hypothetical protein